MLIVWLSKFYVFFCKPQDDIVYCGVYWVLSAYTDNLLAQLKNIRAASEVVNWTRKMRPAQLQLSIAPSLCATWCKYFSLSCMTFCNYSVCTQLEESLLSEVETDRTLTKTLRYIFSSLYISLWLFVLTIVVMFLNYAVNASSLLP